MRVYAIGSTPYSCCAVKNSGKQENLNFNGFKMHIVDGGIHASNMKYFAKAISSDISDYTKLIMHEVELLPHNTGLKSLKSLDENLTKLDVENIVKPEDYVTIPCTAPIELNTLTYYFNSANVSKEKFTPQNIKEKKDIVLGFLESASKEGSTLTHMDKDSQGLQHISNIIKTVNNLVEKGVHVFIPSDHPLEAAIKWKAADMGIKDYLYKYIATGEDKGGQIEGIIKNLKAENAYKFNLLTLSDAHIVNLQNRLETGDYIFSAYDSCVTDRARGVYNFYPVRDDAGKILGFSFTDKTSIHYPVNEFAGSSDIENIAHFVGRKPSDFSYEGNIIRIMEQLMAWEEPHDKLRNIPFPVSCFPKKRLDKEHILEKGVFFDPTETLFFDLNRDRELVFRKCDCEGSGRPSVVAMWGSCFAAVNAMTKSVRAQLKDIFDVKIPNLMKLAEESRKADCFPAAENILKKALELARPEVRKPGFRTQREYDIYTKLYELYGQQGRIQDAEKLLYDAFPDRGIDINRMIKYKIDDLKRGIIK